MNNDYIELVKEAIETLTVNKMRTGLAILGIVIGIGSVITLLSLGQASQKQITDQIQSLGANLLTIMPGGGRSGAVRSAAGSGTTLTLADATAIGELDDSLISQVSPEYSGRSQVTAGRNNTNTSIMGVTSTYPSVHKVDIANGSFLTDRDDQAMTKVAVVGPTVASDLFGDSNDPLGQVIRINSQNFTVIGVTVEKGGGGFGNADDMIFIPLSTAQKLVFGESNLSTIGVEATGQDVMVAAQDAIGYLLLSRHKLATPADADFTIMSQSDILSTASEVTGTITSLLGGIAAISLLVGGIGIMNIMLVTVTERTREIGLRKALGAKQRIIIAQFLIESVILTVAGGILGMVFGLIASYGLSQILSMPFVLSPTAIVLAIGVSSVIGIVFGWYPASYAANLQPIEALRYE